MRQRNKTWEQCAQALIDGGKIQKKLLFTGYDEPYEQFAEKLLPYGLTGYGSCGAMLRDMGKFTALERLCDNSLIDYAKAAKYITFGIEPLIAYLIAKELEIRNVRIAMTGILQGLPREAIAERLRDAYV